MLFFHVARAFLLPLGLRRENALSTLCRFDDLKGDRRHEANVPAEPAPASKDARLPGAHEDAGRAEGSEATASKGTQTADGVAGRFPRRERLTTGADFQALFQRGKRIERPVLVVLWREVPGPTRAGFAVSRQVRGAVERNRVRRRLREAYRVARAPVPAGTALVVIGRPAVVKQPFPELVNQLQSAFATMQASRAAV
jgi:ribonuclease P protein component